MKRVIVTGATSMIGVALIKECIRNNVKVLAIVRKQSAHLNRLPQCDLIEICECDLDSLDSIELNGKSYDVLYHLAWDYTSKENRDNPFLQESNIRYTFDAVKLAQKAGCHKFVGAGSQAEYGRVDGKITPETKVDPEISYGIAKYAAGKLSAKMCETYNITHIWGRVFSVYGCYDNAGTMLTYAIDQFLNGKPAKFSAATQLWDYLHEDDAGRIFYLLGAKAEKNKEYCIASGKSRPLKDFILELKELFEPAGNCEFNVGMGTGKIVELQADISELVRDIDYVPQVTFKEGISKMTEYRKQMFFGGGQNCNF